MKRAKVEAQSRKMFPTRITRQCKAVVVDPEIKTKRVEVSCGEDEVSEGEVMISLVAVYRYGKTISILVAVPSTEIKGKNKEDSVDFSGAEMITDVIADEKLMTIQEFRRVLTEYSGLDGYSFVSSFFSPIGYEVLHEPLNKKDKKTIETAYSRPPRMRVRREPVLWNYFIGRRED